MLKVLTLQCSSEVENLLGTLSKGTERSCDSGQRHRSC